MPRGRTPNIRPQKEVVYVIGEVITEHHYFRHLKAIKGYRYELKPRLFNITSMGRLERTIEDLREDDITVVCAFDADTSSRQAAQQEILNRIIHRWGTDPAVFLCDSLQAIEYWFILHYRDCCPAHINATETLRLLQDHMPGYTKTTRFLEKRQWVERMMSDGKFEIARKRAKDYDPGNSYSRIYKAIDKFESML